MSVLTEKLAAYGVDIPVTLERFVGDENLYETCFKMLLNEKGFDELGRNIADKDYEKAFNSAHALKGVVSNMGLSPLHHSIAVMVEALRARDYSNLDDQYAEMQRQLEIVKGMI